jgi:hypothetical protein
LKKKRSNALLFLINGFTSIGAGVLFLTQDYTVGGNVLILGGISSLVAAGIDIQTRRAE